MARGSAELRKVASCSATQGLWQGDRKVGSWRPFLLESSSLPESSSPITKRKKLSKLLVQHPYTTPKPAFQPPPAFNGKLLIFAHKQLYIKSIYAFYLSSVMASIFFHFSVAGITSD